MQIEIERWMFGAIDIIRVGDRFNLRYLGSGVVTAIEGSKVRLTIDEMVDESECERTIVCGEKP